MRRAVVLHSVVVVLAVLVIPRAAAAQTGFVRWLERLSGPGPFTGAGVQIDGLCFGAEKSRPTEEDPERSTTRRWFFDVNCGRAARNQGRLTIGAELSKLSGKNTLQYDAGIPADQTDHVGATLFLVDANVGVDRPLDIGAAAGFIHFTGFPGGSLSRFVVEPIRLTLKPLAIARGEVSAAQAYRREWLQLRLVATIIPGGFDAEDFGAIPGTFQSGTEFQGNFYVLVNVGNLLGF
jgi:hypothetical protein